MKLLDYYENRGTTHCDVRTDHELQQDISNLLAEAIVIHTMNIDKKVRHIHSLQNRIIGFAYYLLDYQGVYDEIFKKDLGMFSLFAGMVFIHRISFANAEHRLLEISQQFQLATQEPEKENVAKFILCNFAHYNKKELQHIRYQLELLTLSEMMDKPSVHLLYSLAYRKTCWWKSKL